MNTRTKTITASTTSLVAIGLVVAGAFAFGGNLAPSSAPTPTPVSTVRPAADFQDIATVSPSSIKADADRAAQAAAQAAADQAAADAAKAAADQAAAQAAADQAARDAAAKKTAPKSAVKQAAPSTPAPIRCPAGSSANSNDGVNDTSCFPDICFSIRVPDPAHPECDTAFKP